MKNKEQRGLQYVLENNMNVGDYINNNKNAITDKIAKDATFKQVVFVTFWEIFRPKRFMYFIEMIARGMSVHCAFKEATHVKEVSKRKIKRYIKEKGYSWSVDAILAQYEKYQDGEYISHTAKDVIQNCIL
jgi:hypothetical protein